ncbi:hypothetical protein CPB86DRAFT_820064 [Serendipita vermifera]|nr:hypothetical protein CPB86DRAFT_820064 [Serendipita vermifera]
MPIPSKLVDKLFSEIDEDEMALAWVKELVTDEKDFENNNFIFPPSQLYTQTRGNEYWITYGPEHKHYQDGKVNTAEFTIIGAVTSNSTKFEPLGVRKLPPGGKYDTWQLKTVYNSVGMASIDTDDAPVGDIVQDQLWVAGILYNVLKAHQNPTYDVPRGFLWTTSPSGKATNKGGDPKPRHLPLPRKQGATTQPGTTPVNKETASEAKEPTQEEVPQVILPTEAGEPGTLYPPEIIPGYDASKFAHPSQIRALQPPIYDATDKPILPNKLADYLVEGMIVKAKVTFGAYLASNDGGKTKHLVPFTRVVELRIVAADDTTKAKSKSGKGVEVAKGKTAVTVPPKAKKGKAKKESLEDEDEKPGGQEVKSNKNDGDGDNEVEVIKVIPEHDAAKDVKSSTTPNKESDGSDIQEVERPENWSGETSVEEAKGVEPAQLEAVGGGKEKQRKEKRAKGEEGTNKKRKASPEVEQSTRRSKRRVGGEN